MHQNALAQVYARSLFELAHAQGGRSAIEELNDEFEQVVELTRTMPAFGRFLSSPIIDRGKRQASLERILTGRVTPLMLRFLLVLNTKGRLGELPGIAEAFDHLVQEAFGRVEVDVFTAASIGPEAQSMIRTGVQHALGREPVLHTYVEPGMIGGIKFRVGDRLVDGSVQTRLRKVKAAMMRSGGWKLREQLDRLMEDSN